MSIYIYMPLSPKRNTQPHRRPGVPISGEVVTENGALSLLAVYTITLEIGTCGTFGTNFIFLP